MLKQCWNWVWHLNLTEKSARLKLGWDFEKLTTWRVLFMGVEDSDKEDSEEEYEEAYEEAEVDFQEELMSAI